MNQADMKQHCSHLQEARIKHTSEMRNLFFIVGLAFLLLLHLIGSASASVSISFTAGTIRGANGLPVDLNSIGVLVADTAHNGFGTAATLPGSTLLVSSTLGGPGIIILQVFFVLQNHIYS